MRGYLGVDTRCGVAGGDCGAQQAAIADLTQRKQELMYELTTYHNTRSPDLKVWGCVAIAMVIPTLAHKPIVVS